MLCELFISFIIPEFLEAGVMSSQLRECRALKRESYLATISFV